MEKETATLSSAAMPNGYETIKSSGFHNPLANGRRVVVISAHLNDQLRTSNWFKRQNLSLQIKRDIDTALHDCLVEMPEIIIVEVTTRCADGRLACQFLHEEPAYADVQCLALANNEREIQIALDWMVADVVRKPIHWNIVSKRAANLVELNATRKELHETQTRMREAQVSAVDAKQYLTSLERSDALTGLPTAHKFTSLITGALAQEAKIALFYIGAERFHLINDTHGREAGDLALRKLGDRLKAILLLPELYSNQPTGVLAACAARMDGVRFALMVPFDGSDQHLHSIRRILSKKLAEPIDMGNSTLYVSTSIGGATSVNDSQSAVDLLKNAEHAMTSVKKKGGGFSLFNQDGQLSSKRQLQLDGWLREALERSELKVAYQPLVNLWNNRIVGAEALLRWRRADGSYISPAEFIPVAELNGCVVEIGDFVIDKACARLREWSDRGHSDLRIAINLSVTQLRRGNVVRSIERALKTYSLNPHQLEMEISERGDIGSDQRIIRQLHEIKSIGVKLSLDDFGTGDTAIEYLKKLPIDILKLDRSYVSGALENGADAVITSALISLARNMNLTVIAEGVETKEQLELLRSWQCHLYQGFYCSPAIPGNEFADFLIAHQTANEANTCTAD